MTKNNKLKQLQLKDPRLTINRIMSIFSLDPIPYISLITPEKDFNTDDPVFNFVYSYLIDHTHYDDLNFFEMIDEVKQNLAQKYHLSTPLTSFSKIHLGKLHQATDISLDMIQLVLSGATYNNQIGCLYDLYDAVKYNFVDEKQLSVFANMSSYRKLQDLLIRAMVNDGKHIYHSVKDLVNASHGALKEQELNDLANVCLNEQRYIVIRDVLLSLIDSNPITYVKKNAIKNSSCIKLHSDLINETMILPPEQNPVFIPREKMKEFVKQDRIRQELTDSKTIATVLTTETEQKIIEMAKLANFSRSKIFAEVINAAHLVEFSPENLDIFEKMYGATSFPMQVRPNRRVNFSIPVALCPKYDSVKNAIQEFEIKKNNRKRYFGYFVFFIDAFYQQFKNNNVF